LAGYKLAGKRKYRKNKNRTRHLILKISSLLFIAAGIFIIACIWYAPSIVRWQIKHKLSAVNEGPVDVEGVRLNRSGWILINSITLYDKSKHKWLSAENIEAALANWLSLSPSIEEIKIEGLDLEILSNKGRLLLPQVELPKRPSDSNKKTGTKKFAVNKATISVVDMQGSKIIYDNMTLSAVGTNRIYEFKLNQIQSEASETFSADGKINFRNSEFDISLNIKHQITKEQMDIPLTALKIKGVAAEGDIEANLAISGNMKEWTQWQPRGMVQLRNWLIKTSNAPAPTMFNTDMEIKPSGIRLNNLSILDPNGLELLSARSIDANLRYWPGLTPVLTKIEIDSPKLKTELTDDGKFTIPLPAGKTDTSSSISDYLDIQSLLINNAAIIVEKPDNSEVIFTRCRLEAVKQDDSYDVSLIQQAADDSDAVIVTGNVNLENLEVDLSLTVNDEVSKSQINLLLETMNISEFLDEGEISAVLTIKGNLKESMQIQPAGKIKLKDWSIIGKNKKVIGRFDTIIKLNDRGMSLENLVLRDANEIAWMSAKNSTLIITNWLGPESVLTGIDISGMKLKTSFIDGKLQLPISKQSFGSAQTNNEHFDLKKLSVTEASIEITTQKATKIILDNLSLQMTRNADIYDIRLTQKIPDDPNQIKAAATYNRATSEFQLSLQADRTIKTSEMKKILSMLNIPDFYAQGRLIADINISGSIKKLQKLTPTGIVKLRDWIFRSERGLTSNSLNTDILLDGSDVLLKNLTIRDEDNLEWLNLKDADITLKNWPGSRPTVTEIEIDGIDLLAYSDGERICFPVEFPFSKSAKLKGLQQKLPKLLIRNISLGIANRQDSKIFCDYLSLQPAEQTGFYEILLTAKKLKEPQTSRARIEGIINPTSTEARLSLQMNLNARKPETAVVFAALGLPDVLAEGKLVANLTIAGNLNEPARLLAKGSVKIDECVLFVKDKILAKDMATTALLEGHSFYLDEIDALVCNGPADASLFIEAKQNNPIVFGGQFFAEKMSFVEWTSIFGGPGKKATKGSVTINYYFTDIGGDLKDLNGNGQIFLDNADLSVLPIIPYIFRIMGLHSLDPLNISDLECSFNTAGPVIEIKNGHIANPFGAIEAEPGGTINLQTGYIDMYVIAVPLRYLDSLVRQIPLLDIIFNLKDKLIRLYIKGPWSSPPTKLITKTPIEDIKEGTIGFFRDIAKNGGQIGQEMLKGLKYLLPSKQENKN
jgi:hypothetical protein